MSWRPKTFLAAVITTALCLSMTTSRCACCFYHNNAVSKRGRKRKKILTHLCFPMHIVIIYCDQWSLLRFPFSITKAKTVTKSGTNTPFWDQSFFIDNLPSDCSHIVLHVYRSSGTLLRSLTPGSKQGSVSFRYIYVCIRSQRGKANMTSKWL